MTQINPFAGSILQSTVVQRQQAADKGRQLRRAQNATKNAGQTADEFEHVVESTEEVDPIHDEHQPPEQRHPRQDPKGKRAPDADDPTTRLDLTA